MAKIRLIVSEEYNVAGQFVPPNPYGHDVSVGREMEGGDDENMDMDLQADISTNPIPALPIEESRIPIETGNILIGKVLLKLGDNGHPKFIGEGSDGIAYEVGDKVYKLTDSVSEVNDSIRIKGKRNAHLADVYGVYKIINNNSSHGIYVIVLEKLKTDRKKFAELEDKTIEVLNDIFGQTKYRYQNWAMILKTYKENKQEYQTKYGNKINIGFANHPQEKYYFNSLLKIVDELSHNGIQSMDMVYLNLGFKPNGNIAFFDLGRGGDEQKPNSDLLKLENRIFERVMSYMPNSSAVSVKKKCRLGGNGDGTSTACNQGDINALDFKSIAENLYSITTDDYKSMSDDDLNNIIDNVISYSFLTPDGKTKYITDEELHDFLYYLNAISYNSNRIGRLVSNKNKNRFDNNVSKMNNYVNKESYFSKNLNELILKEIKEGISNNQIDDKVGKEFWFEYHCFESPKSTDAEAWYRSHQKVKVLSIAEMGNGNTPEERGENGEPRVYKVEFPDGLKWDVFEDELMNSTDEFYRPNPPKRPTNLNEGITAYHGTGKKFNKFLIDKIGSGDGRDIGGWGIYFTDDYGVANDYTTGNGGVITVDLRNGSYFNFDDTIDDTVAQDILRNGRKRGMTDNDIEQFANDYYDEGYRYSITNKQVYEWLTHVLGSTKNASMYLKKLGYRGNKFADKTNPDATNYVVFDPNDISIIEDDPHEDLDEELEDGYHFSDATAEIVDMTDMDSDNDLVGMDGSTPMPNDSTYIPEGKDQKVEYGAAMVNFKIKDWNKITNIIDKEDIYDKPTFGVEKNPHVTILYGFHNSVKSDDVKKIIESIIDIKKPIEIEITKISYFEVKGQDYDVVKFDITSPILHKLNKVLKELPHTSSFPDYHPHMTISYVKKGTAKKYEQNLKKTVKLRSNEIVFSTKKQSKTILNENHEIAVNSLPFKTDIEQAGGKIYSVGGAVRDGLLNKPSKDLDLLITGLPMDKLEQILSKYGRTDNVGKSFGVLKFNDPKLGELDIAIPRTERANGQGGYQGFDVTSDHTLPIEKDLERRDFTINAIAKDAAGNMIDPYNGQQDLKDKVIRMVNPQAFKDDPLRMIRAVQFAARFGFNIDPETLRAMKENAARIKEISPERILIEFDKIVKKGDPSIGAKILVETGLYENIFGVKNDINYTEMAKVKTMGEFIFVLASGAVKSPADFYKDKLKGDLDTFNEIKAYELAYKHPAKAKDVQTKLTVFGMFKLYPKSLESAIIPYEIKENIDEMQALGMPFSMKDLQINGNDLLALGYSGQQIGELLKKLIIDIYSGKLRNNRELLLNYLTPNNQEV